MRIDLLPATLNSTGVRRARLHGRDFLVAPVTFLVPGVLNGSKGPGLYEAAEIARNPGAWNGMPLIVNHPPEGVSGREPHVLHETQVGTLYRDRVDPKTGKRRGEAWFDVKLTKAYDQKLADEHKMMPRLLGGGKIEVSTGLYTKDLPAVGNARCPRTGRAYTFRATEYRPDHLAVLPDKVGACSVKDGCGVHNAAKKSSRGGKGKAGGHWVTTDGGQHVFIGSGGTFHPKGPDSKPVSGRDAKKSLADKTATPAPVKGPKATEGKSSKRLANAAEARGNEALKAASAADKRGDTTSAKALRGAAYGHFLAAKRHDDGHHLRAAAVTAKAHEMARTGGLTTNLWSEAARAAAALARRSGKRGVGVAGRVGKRLGAKAAKPVKGFFGQLKKDFEDSGREIAASKAGRLAKRLAEKTKGAVGKVRSTSRKIKAGKKRLERRLDRYAGGTGRKSKSPPVAKPAPPPRTRARSVGESAARRAEQNGNHRAASKHWSREASRLEKAGLHGRAKAARESARWNKVRAARTRRRNSTRNEDPAVTCRIENGLCVNCGGKGGKPGPCPSGRRAAAAVGARADRMSASLGKGSALSGAKVRGHHKRAGDTHLTAAAAHAGMETALRSRHLETGDAKYGAAADRHYSEATRHRTAAATHYKASRRTFLNKLIGNEDTPVALSKKRRSQVVATLAANCDCWKGREKALEAMDDPTLAAVARQFKAVSDRDAVIESVRNELGIEKGLALNAMPDAVKAAAKKGKKKEKPDPEPDADEDDMKGNALDTPLEDRLTAEELEVFNGARRLVDRDKAKVRAKLTAIANAARDPKRKTLITNKLKANPGLEALEELLVLVDAPTAPARRPSYRGDALLVDNADDEDADLDRLTADFSGAAGGGVLGNSGEDDEVPPMTLAVVDYGPAKKPAMAS